MGSGWGWATAWRITECLVLNPFLAVRITKQKIGQLQTRKSDRKTRNEKVERSRRVWFLEEGPQGDGGQQREGGGGGLMIRTTRSTKKMEAWWKR